MSKQNGIAAVFIADGRVIAYAADFNRSTPGGFTMAEAQRHRAERLLAFAVVKELASPLLYSGLDAYDCEKIMNSIKGGRVQILQLECPSSEAPEKP